MSQPLITIAEARDRVLRSLTPLGTERAPVADALDRVLAEDLHAAADVPPFACSAMDGYAIRAGTAGRRLELVGESRAGAPTSVRVAEGTAVRISTGAAVPAGATAVIRQEDAAARDGYVETLADSPHGDNVRAAGDDMHSGTLVLHRGTRIGPSELGAAVAAGAATLAVARRPRVAVLCTGDELRAPGEALGPGEIHNSNAPMLAAAVTRCGGVAGEPQRLPDDRPSTTAALAAALAGADVVVISGGVSVGPHDHVKPALAELGVEEVFWGVSLQPGKPTWFGVSGRQLVFGLPGNPVSAVVTFSLFVAPALAAIQGEAARAALPDQAVLARPVARNPRREQAVRVVLERRDDAIVAAPTGPQGSHLVTSLLGAHALALIAPGEGELPAGTTVALAPLIR